MQLVIAEKPSVAQSLARVIGANKRCDGYLEGNGYVVSWCVGHLVELSPPQTYDERYVKWRVEDLPIVPREWLYSVSEATKRQFRILRTLMGRKDVKSLICATDAGREGELIFRLVYNQAKCKKPFERLWMSSMEDDAIRDGFRNLKPGKEYDTLYEAALCRERADWIVGMNATRLFSCLYRQTLAVGRVMTPTLAMVVERDAQIAAFKPEPFWTVEIDAGGITVASRRFVGKKEAEDLLTVCREVGEVVVKSVETKEKVERPLLLYDLTSLQRDANRLLGFTAQQTLDYTQSLYEKKLVTYPRTDSRYLTDDMKDMLPELIVAVAKKIGYEGVDFRTRPARPDAIFNSKKVTDHHAIIPTRTLERANLNDLPSGEKSILQLISVRLLCAAAKDHRYAETMIELSCGGETFKKNGKIVLSEGWKGIFDAFYKQKEDVDRMQISVPAQNTALPITSTALKEAKTAPMKHFTEDTLLRAMETAGADEIPDETERKGLGTPATRAATIEKLVQRGFLERRGDKKTRHLVATEKGNSLITVMPEQIQSASMTAEWETKLLRVQQGELSAKEFMEEIEAMIADLVRNYKNVRDSEMLMKRKEKHYGRKLE